MTDALNRADELTRFKHQINLVDYACYALGYELSRAESSTNSIVIRDPGNGDKVVVAKAANLSWMYFSVRDDRDNGTIIDFVQNRGFANLGLARKELRRWVGRAATQPVKEYAGDLKPADFRPEAVLAKFSTYTKLTQSAYLSQRGIPNTSLAEPRFANMIRQGAKQNVIFPHYHADGLCGYELKNTKFTGFAKYGRRGFWSSQCFATDTRLVIAESAIDCLSYYLLHDRPEHTRFLSSAGSLSGYQQRLILSILKDLPPAFEVISAFDNDVSGNKYHAILADLFNEKQALRRDVPQDKDWNADLTTHKQPLSLADSCCE